MSAPQEPSVGAMLQSFIQAGITSENVSAFETLCNLKERMEDRQASKDFAEALVDLQGETCRIPATKPVYGKDGSVRYNFAPYEEIMEKTQPLITKHGFSITFDTEIGEGRLTSICTLTHRSGHIRQNRFAVKFSTPPGSSEAQGDMSTKSYAKRGALCDALNIVIDKDDDGQGIGDNGKSIGAYVTDDQAATLRELCEATNADKPAFLRFAGGAKSFEEVAADRYDELLKILKKKEAAL